MVDIEITFLTGRYHSTPWGRNVNEGVPEWPPSPYRIARALVDVWKRKLSELPEDRFFRVLEIFAAPPVYCLPPWKAGHIRYWMPSNDKDASSRRLIFDPFVTLARGEKVFIRFDSSPSPEALSDLSSLLERLSFLGRSESWVKAAVWKKSSDDIRWNCSPDPGAAAGRSSLVPCLAPGEGSPKEWLAALCRSTADLLSEGRDRPPFFEWVNYSLPERQAGNFFTERKKSSSRQVRCALYALSSKVLPLAEETLSFAERARAYLMGIHRKINNGDPAMVSPRFSGKDEQGNPMQGHRHAFFQPLDTDGDGRIDHLLVYGKDPFDPGEIRALDRLRTIWQPKGRPEVNTVLMSLSDSFSARPSTRWVSATPFVTSRHYRKGRGTMSEWIENELLRELEARGLPRPVRIEPLDGTAGGKKKTPWWAFRRARKGEVPLTGYGFLLEFDIPLQGVFSLGSLCHFGLGLFVPEKKE